MAQQSMYAAKANSPQTELSVGINASVTSIALSDASVLPAGPNLAVIGNDETAETIKYTSITGNTLNGVTRGFQGTAKSWSVGAKVARYFTAYDHDAFRQNILDLDTRAIISDNAYYAMARQALMNGNFDIWQRGTIFTNPNNLQYVADRWRVHIGYATTNNLTHSRQQLTSGDLQGSFYYHRLTTDGAGTSPAEYRIAQPIERGTRYLCGSGKKVTVSFWAKSNISGKKIGVFLIQNYGSGGSPSSQEIINGTNFSLNSNWTKCTYTFTTNTLAGKTFGTSADDFLGVYIAYAWDSLNQARVGASNEETFRGAGNIDIAQVQVSAGDSALPFWPKSVGEELRACQRYFETLDSTTQAGGRVALGVATAVSTTVYNVVYTFKVAKRVIPTLVQGGGGFRILPGGTVTTVSFSDGTKESINLSCSGSGLTLNQSAVIQGVDGSTTWIGFDAEL